MAKKDFFISYNKADGVWAEWMAWQLEEAGHTTVLQAWDFRPGSNFVLSMDRAAREAERIIAVLSPNYLDAKFTQPEWASFFRKDPTGEAGLVVPVRVGQCDVDGLLGPIIYIDLVGQTEEDARRALLAGLERGRAKPAAAPVFPGTAERSVRERPSFPGAVPHAGPLTRGPTTDPGPAATLTLNVAFADDKRTRWDVKRRQDGRLGRKRTIDAPWAGSPAFVHALEDFWRLSVKPLERESDRRRLEAQARVIGDGLAAVLTPQQRETLVAEGRGDGPPPFLVIESDDDLVLSLPWELLWLDGRFAVRDGRLDVARCVPARGAPELGSPEEHLRLLVTVAAPTGSKLDYEAESYRVTKALQDHVGVRVNEMGEVSDLLDGLKADPPPLGVHFSGHGERGRLLFENDVGDGVDVEVSKLLSE